MEVYSGDSNAPQKTVTREELGSYARNIEHVCRVARNNGYILPGKCALRSM